METLLPAAPCPIAEDVRIAKGNVLHGTGFEVEAGQYHDH